MQFLFGYDSTCYLLRDDNILPERIYIQFTGYLGLYFVLQSCLLHAKLTLHIAVAMLLFTCLGLSSTPNEENFVNPGSKTVAHGVIVEATSLKLQVQKRRVQAIETS